MYKGFKSNKLKNAAHRMSKQLQERSYGIGTLPSDNMNKIMTHEFEKEYINIKNQRQDIEKERYQLNKIMKRGQHTKASKIRLEYQQNQKMLNNTTIEPSGGNRYLSVNKTTIDSGSGGGDKLPALKVRRTPDEELMRLIKRNQSVNLQKNAALSDKLNLLNAVGGSNASGKDVAISNG